MRFQQVEIAGIGWLLPERRVPSEALEERLGPVYDALGVSTGRLELMTGIRERRHFEPGTRPSAVAAEAGERALAAASIPRARIGLLVHASVCRDFLEPATASVVHHRLGLAPECGAFDLSNACLGFANALVQVAGAIEQGTIEAGLVVAGEDGGPLVEETIRGLLAAPRVSRAELKLAFASLTIGSGAAAMVVARRGLARPGPALRGSVTRAATEHHALCHGAAEGGAEGPTMRTDSEALLHAGNALAGRTWLDFLQAMGWRGEDVDRVVTHQVGVAHRRLLLSTLGIEPARDFPTVEELGNMGSVSLPLTFARALESGFLGPGHRVAMLGIGSGLQCQMLGVDIP
jgi:acyl-CoA:acyl-CoA alkyltransferase